VLRTLSKSVLILATFVIIAVQFTPAVRSNPPVQRERSFENQLHVTPQVAGILRRACMDCHSNETRWPWYSHIAPVSWAIARDVNRGRQVFNLSEWSTGPGRNPAFAASMLATMCVDARSGRMPRFPYSYAHPDAKLSKTEVANFCAWTQQEFARLTVLNAELRGRKKRVLHE
jgi:hypothetical protein